MFYLPLSLFNFISLLNFFFFPSPPQFYYFPSSMFLFPPPEFLLFSLLNVFYSPPPPIKVETLSLTKFSSLLSLLLNAIGNIRQSLKTPQVPHHGLRSFLFSPLVRSLHGTKHYGTWCRNKLLISKTFSLVSYHVSSNCCFCWTKRLEYSCSTPWDGAISNLRNHPIAR